MSVTLRLHMFSGREDPLITLSEEDYREFLSLDVDKHRKAKDADRGLGYRGFSIMHDDEGRAGEIREQFGELAEHDEVSSFIGNQPELDSYIAFIAKGFLDDFLVHRIHEDILRELVPRYVPKPKCPPCYGQDAPAYNPGFWNAPARQPYNNCYNYANDKATNTFAQPGRGTGQMYGAITCKEVGAAATRDGLRGVASFKKPTPGWYVALVVAPGYDYHWYRQDDNGCWSHKPGGTAARNTDNSGNQITDPRTCDRGVYTNFCCFMVTNRTVRIA